MARAGRTPVGVGFDAWGSIARVHVLGLKALPVIFPDLPFTPVLAGVSTRSPDRNGEWIRESGFARTYGSPAALIEDPAVDGVDICTPNALHTETAIAAWRAGKAVYTEKPLAESLAPARRMAEAYRAAAALSPRAAASQVAFTIRFWPATARAKDWLEEGRLGRILSFRARMVHGGYLDPGRVYSWRLDRGLAGGGALADLGVHLIDLVHFLLGPMAEVRARARTFVQERPAPGHPGGRARVEVDDWAEITCTLRSGAVGTIEATRGGDGQEETALEIFGTEGSLRLSSGAQQFPLWFDRAGGNLLLRSGERPGPYLQALQRVYPPAKLSMGSFVDTHMASLHWWLRRVTDPAWAEGLPPLAASIDDGLAAQEVLEAAYAAAGS
ncbi:MAG: Gfo/Idh/MocA family protein [Bacillota bacterium]